MIKICYLDLIIFIILTYTWVSDSFHTISLPELLHYILVLYYRKKIENEDSIYLFIFDQYISRSIN